MTRMPTTGKAAIAKLHIFCPRQKDPRLVALAEAVEAVVSHQTTPGTYPSTVGCMVA